MATVLLSLREGYRDDRLPDVLRRVGGRDGGGPVESWSDGSPLVLTMVVRAQQQWYVVRSSN